MTRHVRVVWQDPGDVRFIETDAPVGGDVYASWAKAKSSVLADARGNRDLWAALVREVRSMTRADVE